MSETITSAPTNQYLTSTVMALIETCRKDVSVAPILADALQEAGYESGTIHALRSPIDSYDFAAWILDNLGVSIGTVKADRLAVAACEVHLSRANGRRRTRLLSLSDIAYAVKCARQKRTYHTVAGGTVANAYSYPAARTMCVVAIRTDGSIRIGITEGTASKGSSVTNQVCGLTVRATDEQFRAWADQSQVS